MSDVDELLREMDSEGDGWYGRAAGAIKELRAKVEELEKENFRLASITCEAPYGDDGGSKRCKTVDTLTAERDRLRAELRENNGFYGEGW